ncbi:MAG: YbiU family protein [Candidatus Velthaea sp.]
MAVETVELQTRIRESKAALRRGLPNLDAIFAEVAAEIGGEVAQIAERSAAGEPVVPEVAYADIVAARVPAALPDEIRRRGCAVVRGVFPAARVAAWNAELGEYLERNAYIAKSAAKAGLDRYFSTLNSSRPQIYGIYWSKPQVFARQSEELAATRAWLSNLWQWQTGPAVHFTPDRQCSYSDRIRRREPGDATLGLSPHMDGGSVERWIDPAFQSVYRHVFSGEWQRYDPFDGAYRTEVKEIPSPAVCRMFRTFQGWTALTEQGPGDGTLLLLPISRSIVYVLLRALLDDVAPDALCGAQAGRALGLLDPWHTALRAGIVPIPRMYPGDTIWWHPDLLHAVEDVNTGRGESNVMYISAAPACAKNRAFLELQKPAFLSGKSSPDFAAEDYEVDFADRATLDDLTARGREQMGFE